MKKSTLGYLSVAMLAATGLSGCVGLGSMVKKAGTVKYEVTPKPLEMHGDSVAVAISGKFPAKYFAKKAVVVITPVIKTASGETTLKPVTVQGEKATGSNGSTIKLKEGGSFSYNDKVVYKPEMKTASLELKAAASIKSNKKDFPAVKVGEGTIVTPLLVKNDEKASLAPNNFQKVVPVSFDANIYFLVNQSTVRPTEMNGNDMKALREFVKNGVKDGNNFLGVQLSAYASPDGEQSLNTNLAGDRAKASIKYLQQEFKKLKIESAKSDSFYNGTGVGEDWEGFKELMTQSNVKDKEVILRILSSYSDLDVREKEIKNMSVVYDEVSKNILPQLRRAKIKLNGEKKAKTDEELTKLATSTPDSLNAEEMLYAATLLSDLDAKLKVYQAMATKFSDDWRGPNNAGYVYLAQKKTEEAFAEFEKANKLSSNNPAVQNNLGIAACRKGDRAAAETYYKNSGTSDASYNMGIINILNGKYSDAVSNYGSACSFNAALAKLLAGNTEGAISTIDCSDEKASAWGYYIKALVGARTSNTDLLFTNLKSAVQADGSLKTQAKEDMEFWKFKDSPDFKNIIQ